MSEVTIWDGEEIRQVPDSEAKELIAKDMAQDMAKEDGLSLKFRKDFTGYKTRELRAETPPTPVTLTAAPEQSEVIAASSSGDGQPSDAGDEAALNWEDFKEEYKTATGKKRATKAAVEAWMADQ